MKPYDGTANLQPAIADLLGYSPKCQAQIARAVKQAKGALGIPATPRVLSPSNRLAVYLWLEAQIKAIAPPVACDVTPPVEMQRLDDNATFKFAFYTSTYNVKVRQVIGLHGFYVNALMSATGINKAGVPAWIQSAVDGWSAFDDKLPITKQVKLLIVRELENRLS